MDLVVRALFELNGKRMQAEVRVPDHADPSTGLPKIRDKVAEVISTEMLASVFAAAGLPRR